jgi:exodeoxyribonuclease VII large subunit
VAVITSFQADALQDVLKTARIRAPFVDILVVGVPVQGEAAAPAVAQAIAAVDRRADELGIDAMIVTRGGGSIEDLWAFNERIVAEAVFNAKTPVISAIGHESDVTIIDFVADHRASTPTQAVMELFPDREAEGEQVDSLSGRMNRSARRRVEDARRHLSMLARHPLFRSPRAPIDLRRADLGRLAVRLAGGTRATHAAARHRLADACARFERHRPAIRQAAARERLHSFEARLHSAARRSLADLRGQLSSADRQLRLLGPGETLARGWSLTFAADGSLLRSAADAGAGQELRTQFADGSVRSRVEPAADTPSSTLFGPHGG